jgi:hypothetical protein
MKWLFESVFQPLIDQAEKAAYVVEALALGFLIGVTKMYIAAKPAIKAIGELLGFEDTSLADTLDMARKAGEYLAPALLVVVGIFGALAVAVTAVIAVVVGIQLAIYALGAAMVSVGISIVQGFLGAWEAVKSFLSALDFGKLGSDLIDGFVGGITGNAGKVVAAITGVASNAINAARTALGIASPSKVFEKIGAYTGEGFAGGVADSSGGAQAAMTAMVEPPAPALSKVDALGGNFGAAPSNAPAPAAEAAPAQASSGLNLAGASFNFYGVKDADDAESRLGSMLTKLLEGDATALGEAVPA